MKKIILMLALFFVSSYSRSEEILVADGSSSGTYAAMLTQMNKMCGNNVKMVEVPSTGAIDNLDKLVGNEAQLAFMHSDVIQFRASNEGDGSVDFKNNFKTLIALYPEDVHFLVLNKPYKQSGYMNAMKSGRELNTISDLTNLPVGAAGGGYVTIQYVRVQSEIAYLVKQYNNGHEVLDALNSGEIACAVFVGAAPLPNLKDLDNNYKLLSVGDSVSSKLKSLYKLSTVSYPKMSVEPVHTIAAECLLVSKVVKTPRFVAALKDFRNCFYSHLDELKETPGTHRAWQKVSASNHGKWEWNDLK